MERPIILKGHEVRGILDGRQTQLRRIIKPTPPDGWSPTVFEYCPTCIDKHGEEYPGAPIFGASDEDFGVKCPFGQVGDRLWGKETFGWQTELEYDPSGGLSLNKGTFLVYRCDSGLRNWELSKGWCSAAQMPRWGSRILLEIANVRVERLQDISEADAHASGVECWQAGNDLPEYRIADVLSFGGAKRALSLLHKNEWPSNPWVWVVEFERVDAA